MNDKTKKLFGALADIHPEVRYLPGVGEPQKITLSPIMRRKILKACKEAGLVFRVAIGGCDWFDEHDMTQGLSVWNECPALSPEEIDTEE